MTAQICVHFFCGFRSSPPLSSERSYFILRDTVEAVKRFHWDTVLMEFEKMLMEFEKMLPTFLILLKN